MATEYLRACSLIVGNSSEAIELGVMHCKFSVKHHVFATPDNLLVRIYNLSDATVNTIQNEYTRVQLMAGYQGPGTYGLVFTGAIVWLKAGHETNVDSFLDVYAADGDGSQYAVLIQTLAAGHTQQDVLGAIQQSYSSTAAIGTGYTTSNLVPVRMPRGRALYGSTDAYLRDFAFQNGVHTYFLNGQLEVGSQYDAVPNDVVVLNSLTGLIGWPQQTPDGLQCRCLLNPALKQNRMIQINNAEVQKAVPPNLDPAQQAVFLSGTPSLSTDGIYKIYAVDHTGDTRGNDWYSDLWCAARTGYIAAPGIPLTSPTFKGAQGPYQFQHDTVGPQGNPDAPQPMPIPVPSDWNL